MYNILNNYKRILFLLIKLAIVIGAVYYIFQKLIYNQQLSLEQLKEQFYILYTNNIWALLLVLLLTDANWFLEIFKWKALVASTQKITFFEAYKQCLSSLTVSIITPNRIGEYGAKAIYFEKGKRKNILFLNLIGNFSQLGITLFFGCIGLIFLFRNFNFQIPNANNYKVILLVLFILVIVLFRKKLKIQSIQNYFKNTPLKVYIKVVLFSFLRYLFFTHQFMLLLYLFGVKVDYFTILQLLFCMYLIASIIPGLTIFDWVIKGSVAVWLFSLIGLNELTIISITTIMWILNFAIPALIGSIFVLNFKPNRL